MANSHERNPMLSGRGSDVDSMHPLSSHPPPGLHGHVKKSDLFGVSQPSVYPSRHI